MSNRARWVVAGVAVVAVCTIATGLVAPAWLLWRVLDVPPATQPAEYTDFRVTRTDQCLLIRNTGPAPFFTGRIHYRVARNDGTADWYDGDQVFLDWRPGEDVVVFLPARVQPGGVVVEIAGTAQKEPAGQEYRLRYGPATPPPDGAFAKPEEVGFDPDLAAATDGQAEPKR